MFYTHLPTYQMYMLTLLLHAGDVYLVSCWRWQVERHGRVAQNTQN